MDDLEKLLAKHREGKRFRSGYTRMKEIGYGWFKETETYIAFNDELDNDRIFIQKSPKDYDQPIAFKQCRNSIISKDSWVRGQLTLKEIVAIGKVIEEEKLTDA